MTPIPVKIPDQDGETRYGDIVHFITPENELKSWGKRVVVILYDTGEFKEYTLKDIFKCHKDAYYNAIEIVTPIKIPLPEEPGIRHIDEGLFPNGFFRSLKKNHLKRKAKANKMT